MLRRQAIPLSLIALVLLVFWPAAGFDFLSYDDGFNITHNWRVTRFSVANLLSFWRGPYENLYIPLTYNLWSLLARLSEFWPGGQSGVPAPGLFHAANLLVHGASTLVVLAILRSLGVGGWAAWGGAVAFALHPVQVEAVAWATGMKDLLSGFLSFIAIWQYTVYARAERGVGRRLPYTLAAVALVLAMLAKPGAVVTPLLLLIIGRLILDRGWRRLGLEILPLAMLAVPVVVATKLAQPESRHAWQPDLWQRLLVSGDTLSFYLGKLVWPFSLGPDYGCTLTLVLGRGPWLYPTVLLPVVILTAIWLRSGRRWRAAALLFVASLLPVSGLLLFDFQKISTVADRYLYPAMLGPALALGWGLARYRARSAWLLFAAVAALLAGKSFSQVWTWENSLVFSSHAVRINPRSWVAHNNLGIVKADRGEERAAIAAFEASLAANPEYSEAHNNLGALLYKRGREQEAMTHLQRALALDPGSFKAAFHLAEIAGSRGGAPEEAIAYYRQALAAKPDFVEAYNNLGLLLLTGKRPQEALTLFQEAVASCPPHARLYYNLARSHAELGQREESIAALFKATTIDPRFGPAYHQLARAYRELGDEESALRYEARAREFGFTE